MSVGGDVSGGNKRKARSGEQEEGSWPVPGRRLNKDEYLVYSQKPPGMQSLYIILRAMSIHKVVLFLTKSNPFGLPSPNQINCI